MILKLQKNLLQLMLNVVDIRFSTKIRPKKKSKHKNQFSRGSTVERHHHHEPGNGHKTKMSPVPFEKVRAVFVFSCFTFYNIFTEMMMMMRCFVD